MTINLSREAERLIAEAVENGVSPSAAELVDAAVKWYLGSSETGRYRALRERMEAASLPLLDEEGIRREVAERRGCTPH